MVRKARSTSFRELLTGKSKPRQKLTIKVGKMQKSIPKRDVEARLSPEDLERVYRVDEIVFGIVNKYVSVLLPDYMIIGDEPLRTEIEDLCKRLYLRPVLTEALRDSFVHGQGYVELVKNAAGNDIVKLSLDKSGSVDMTSTMIDVEEKLIRWSLDRAD